MVIIFTYSAIKNSMKYAIIELLLAFSVGFIFETFNININQHYSYPYSFFYIGIVPISILVGWYTIFMFGKFWTLLFIGIVNSFKDNKPINITSRISFIPIIVLSTAYLAAAIVHGSGVSCLSPNETLSFSLSNFRTLTLISSPI